MTLPALLAILGCTPTPTPTGGHTSDDTDDTDDTASTGPSHSTGDTGSSSTADTATPATGTTADTGTEPELQCRRVTQDYYPNNLTYSTQHVTYLYDARGNLVSQEYDQGWVLDGIIDLRQDGIYDAGDRLTSWCYDQTPADGLPGECDTFTYDAGGHMVELENRAAGSVPLLGLGTYVYAWDAGQCTGRTKPEGLAYGDYWTWDVAGNMLSDRHDSGLDGVVDWIETYTYDANGWLALLQFDSIPGRSGDDFQSVERDAAGNVLHWRIWRWGGHDFVCTSDSEYTYNALGRLIGWVSTDCLGLFQIGTALTLTYDADGNRITMLDTTNSGKRWTWDDHHNLLSEEDLLDGRLQWTYRWTYECFPAGTFPAPSVPGGGPCDPPIPGYRTPPGSEELGPQ